MPLYFFYTMVQKSQKWPKLKSRGPALSGNFCLFEGEGGVSSETNFGRFTIGGLLRTFAMTTDFDGLCHSYG